MSPALARVLAWHRPLLTWQAARGQSVLNPDGLTLAVLTGLLIAAGLVVGVVLSRAARPAA